MMLALYLVLPAVASSVSLAWVIVAKKRDGACYSSTSSRQ
jgi:hypothetical protein